jgi:Gpi18-like mannosyltransferase
MVAARVAASVKAQHRIAALAIATRIGVLSLALLSRKIIGPYDTSAPLSPLDPSASHPRPAVDAFVQDVAFGGLANWDGVHFLHIAEAGYWYEHQHAFFPLLPIATRVVRWGLFGFLRVDQLFGVPLQIRSQLLISGVLLSNACFVGAAIVLLSLSRAVLGNDRRAFVAAALFCISPASIFFSAFYTESIFALLTFGGLRLAHEHHRLTADLKKATATAKGAKRMCWDAVSSYVWLVGSVATFVLASTARSNGATLAPFFLGLPTLLRGGLCFPRPDSQRTRRRPRCGERLYGFIAHCLEQAPRMAFAVLAPVVPFLALQDRAARDYCSSHRVAAAADEREGFSLIRTARAAFDAFLGIPSGAEGPVSVGLGVEGEYPTPTTDSIEIGATGRFDRAWCARPMLGLAGLPPNVYAHVQKEYWGIGPFAYWRPEQLPNFALAAPVFLLALSSLGAWRSYAGRGRAQRFEPPWARAAPYVSHLTLLLAVGVTTMHVQVMTRFLSASPPLYWHAADLLLGDRARSGSARGRRVRTPVATPAGMAVMLWSAVYAAVGTLLFSTFYPWT